MVLLYNMLFMRERYAIHAHLDYTLQSVQTIQYERIDADLTGLLAQTHRKQRQWRNAIYSLTKYLSSCKYNEPNFLRDVPKKEREQFESEDEESYDDYWKCEWNQIPVEITKALENYFNTCR